MTLNRNLPKKYEWQDMPYGAGSLENNFIFATNLNGLEQIKGVLQKVTTSQKPKSQFKLGRSTTYEEANKTLGIVNGEAQRVSAHRYIKGGTRA